LAAPPLIVQSVSLACRDSVVREFLSGYLRYLAAGLGHLGPQRFYLRLTVVAPEKLPILPLAAEPVSRHPNYRTASLGRHFFYDSGRGACLRVTPTASRATVWVSRQAASNQRLLMELVSVALLELARHRGFYGVHTAAVTKDGAGCLLPGPSGSGKTSLALALIRHAGFQYVTDDFVFLAGGPDDVRCVAFFRTFNLDPMWVDHYTELSFIKELPPLESGKRNFSPEQLYRGSHVGECRPAFIVFPRIVAGPESVLRPIPQTEAFRRLLGESALSPSPQLARRQLATLGALVRQSSTYEFLHGRDFLTDPGRAIGVLVAGIHPRTAGRVRAL
jgi:hypothetical protein